MIILQRDVDMNSRFRFYSMTAAVLLSLTFGAFSVAQAGGPVASTKPVKVKEAAKPVSKTAPKPVAQPAKPVVKPAPAPAAKPVAKPAPAKVTEGDGGTQVMEEKLSKTMVSFKMVKLPGGVITMPDAKNIGKTQDVTIKPFWMGQKEVGWEEYDSYMFKLDMNDAEAAKIDVKLRPSLPYGAPDRGFGHEGFAAISLHHNAGEQYCKWLTNKTGKKYRLPTEAEWEYACRAGGDGKISAADVEKVAWVKENSDEATHPMGEKTANAWGLYDMLGNAGEWVSGYDGDWVLKGGSFKEPADKVNSSWRAKQTTAWHDPNKPKSVWWLADGPFAGFRVVCEE